MTKEKELEDTLFTELRLLKSSPYSGQLLLLIAKCLLSFASGLNLAFPSVLNQAILSPNADIKATPGQASWIVASLGISGWIGFVLMPSIFEIYGRKINNVVTCIITLIGGFIFYVSTNVFSLACARLVQGLAIGGSFVGVISISECVSPKRRGYFIVLYKVFLGVGSLACHSLSFVLNWRQIAICGALPSIVSIVIFIICAESPAFLAKRGEFDKCARSFEWYRGKSLNAKKELHELITAQENSLRTNENQKSLGIFKKLKNMAVTKEYRKSLFIVTLATLCIDTCGRYFLLAYITHILVQVTNDTILTMFISVAFDCTLILALCVSSVLVKRFNRRTLLFKFGFFSGFLMFMVSVSIILRSQLTISLDLKWLTLSLILLHTFIINVGLVPVAFALTGEVYSLDHRGLGSCMSGIINSSLLVVIMKLTPAMIDNTGVEGTFSVYGFCLCISLLLLNLILPETKDKTLQQIEDEMKGLVKCKPKIHSMKYSKVSNH